MATLEQQILEVEIKELLDHVIGPKPPFDTPEFDDWYETSELIRQAVGPRLLKPKRFLYRCQGCYKIRTNKEMLVRPCKCGSMLANSAVPTINTEDLRQIIQSGY